MLGIELLEQGQEDKLPGFERLLKRAGVTAGQTAYVGDDLLDAAVMRRAGISIAVRNAVEEIKVIASHVTRRAGGEGAVREAVESGRDRGARQRRRPDRLGSGVRPMRRPVRDVQVDDRQHLRGQPGA
jgi:hypothetical protein